MVRQVTCQMNHFQILKKRSGQEFQKIWIYPFLGDNYNNNKFINSYFVHNLHKNDY